MLDKVHLVDGQHDMADAHHARDIGVTQGLDKHALARINHHHGYIGGGGASRHIARILLVTRCISDNEFTLLGREKAIGDIDRDALFALGLKTVQKESEIDFVADCAVLATIALEHIDLVLEQQLAVIEQTPDQRRLAVIDRTTGQKTKYTMAARLGQEAHHVSARTFNIHQK